MKVDGEEEWSQLKQAVHGDGLQGDGDDRTYVRCSLFRFDESALVTSAATDYNLKVLAVTTLMTRMCDIMLEGNQEEAELK